MTQRKKPINLLNIRGSEAKDK